MDIPEQLIHETNGERHVFWIDKGTCHLRHGSVRTVRGEVVFVAVTALEVVAIGIDELVAVPPFFKGSEE